MEIKEMVEAVCEAKKEVGGLRQVYFVACGGSLGAFYSANYFLQREAVGLRSAAVNSNEFVHEAPSALDGESSCCGVLPRWRYARNSKSSRIS